MLKLISLITGRKIVLLLDYEGKLIRTIECKGRNPFTGTKYCYVHWFTKIGFVNMHEDGKTSGTSYIKKWKYE